MKFFCYLLLVPLVALSKPTIFSCKVEKELENDKPAKKELFRGKEINLFLEKDKNWLYEKNKKEWKIINIEKLNKVSSTFLEDEKKITFIKKNFHTDKKKELESIDKIIFKKENGYMTFLKTYYDGYQNEFFKSEIIGWCRY